jgi:hypothetical protein
MGINDSLILNLKETTMDSKFTDTAAKAISYFNDNKHLAIRSGANYVSGLALLTSGENADLLTGGVVTAIATQTVVQQAKNEEANIAARGLARVAENKSSTTFGVINTLKECGLTAFYVASAATVIAGSVINNTFLKNVGFGMLMVANGAEIFGRTPKEKRLKNIEDWSNYLATPKVG